MSPENRYIIEIIGGVLRNLLIVFTILLASIFYLASYLFYLVIENKASTPHHIAAVLSAIFLVALLASEIGRKFISFGLSIIKDILNWFNCLKKGQR